MAINTDDYLTSFVGLLFHNTKASKITLENWDASALNLHLATVTIVVHRHRTDNFFIDKLKSGASVTESCKTDTCVFFSLKSDRYVAFEFKTKLRGA